MKKTLALVLFAILAMQFLTACQRRPLEDEFSTHAIIPVRIDWSASGVPVDKMHRASVVLFPQDGGTPLEYYLESDLTYRLIEVPVGVYSVVVFNETMSDSDWTSISFIGTNSYEEFAAIGRPDVVQRGSYVHSDELPLMLNPEPLAAWSLDHFEVTKDVVVRSRAATRATIDVEIPDLTQVKPCPRYEHLCITARIQNLTSCMQATGTINSMASGVYMVSGQLIKGPAAHAFVLNGRVYEENLKHGTTTRTFNIFGRCPQSRDTHQLNLDFVLTDGTAHPRELFEAANLFGRVDEAIPPLNKLDVSYCNNHPDHEIVLPDSDMVSDITVDDWEDVIIPL